MNPDWLESTVIGITGVETGVGSNVPRSRDDVSFVKGVVYDLKGKKDKDISLGIGKTKLASLDSFAKEYFDIAYLQENYNITKDLPDGGTAGAIIGSILGNMNSNSSGGTRTVCQTETRYTEQSKTVYSHSTINFVYNGKQYSLNFKK